MSEVNSIDWEGLSRDDLIARAAGLGVVRPELMTRVELRDEIIRLSETDEQARKRARGWLGVARDMVASVVEQRLNLPDAAELIRGFDLRPPRNIPPVATVTLAEIYAAQGHMGRAIKLLDEVLLREPDHEAAMALRTTLVQQQSATVESTAVELPIEASELAGFEPVAPTEGEPIIVEPEIAAESLEVVAAAAAAAEATAAAAEAEAAAAAAAAAEAEAVAAAAAAEAEAIAAAAAAAEAEAVAAAAAAEAEAIAAAAAAAATVTAAGAVPAETGVVAPIELDHDVLLYRRCDATVVCHWAIRPDTWEQWESRNDGQWILRMIQVTPSEAPVAPFEVDVPMPGATGEVLINEVTPRPQVRMALGWQGYGQFWPVVIGVEVAGDSPEQVRVAWAPLPGLSDPAPSVWLDHARNVWPALTMGAGACS